MSFQLSAQAITAHTAITRMSVSRCSILPPQRGSLTASKWPTSRSIAMLRSPTFGEEDHPWLGNSPASGISCVAPDGRPHHHLSLDPSLRRGTRKADPAAAAAEQRLVAGGRDLFGRERARGLARYGGGEPRPGEV